MTGVELGEVPQDREHYPYVTRSLIRLYEHGALTNVAGIVVEPDYGYVAAITYHDGSHRITYGNDLGLNNAAACDLSKDKGHSKFMLRSIGVNCPEGSEFLLPWWEERIGDNQRTRGHDDLQTTAMADSYIQDNLGYPVYVKPVDGSKGADIYLVDTPVQLDEVFGEYNEKKIRVAMVEEPITMPDYRVVVLDGDLISAYQRVPLTVVGDGRKAISELIQDLQSHYEADGRDTRLDVLDPRIERYLSRIGRTIEDVPLEGEVTVLQAISNLSAGGNSVDVTDIIHSRWVDLAVYVARNFNLRLLGIDLACDDITDPDSEYCVFESNAAPGLDHYAMAGEAQKQLVDELYTAVFNAAPLSA